MTYFATARSSFTGDTMHIQPRRLVSVAAAISFMGISPLLAFCQSGAEHSPKFGGEPAITLSRARTGDGAKLEFLSATVLPGRGMDLFQITAWLPGKGEIPLLFSPSLEEAEKVFNAPVAPYSTRSFSFGGAFLAPFANRIVGPLSNDGKTVSFSWDGRPMTLDANWSGKKPGAVPHAIHGLILESKADDVSETTKGGMTTLSGVIHGGDFGGHWFSKTDLTISIALGSDAVIATIEAINTGNMPEPIGLAWHPYFNLPSGDRAQARLFIPGDQRTEVNDYDDVFPTGKLLPVQGTSYDFTSPAGTALKDIYLDDNWTNFKKAADGTFYTEIIDPAAKYGLRITALSKDVNTIQVYAPPDKAFVVLEPQFNFNDAFGKEWGNADTKMVTIQPGQSVTWRVRLELFVP